MSNSQDGQFGPAGHTSGGPAQIVWHDNAPGATAAWAGPGAFDADPAPEQAAARQDAPQAFDPAATIQHAPSDDAPAAGHPGSDTPAPQPAGNDPYARPQHEKNDPYAPPQQADPYAAPQQTGDDSHASNHAAAAGAAVAGAGAAGAAAWGARDDRDAWSAHRQGDAPDQPMAADPAAGEAIPTPPAGDDSAGPSAAAEPGDDDALTIGRSRDNSIVLDDMLVSRRHLRITADDEGLLLEDLGSRNGTYVNGRRVERAHLQEGDRIGVGGTTFEVRNDWLVTI